MDELYLVTGASGHLGNAVVRKLLEMGKNIRILVLEGDQNIPNGNIDVCYGDVCNRDSLTPFFDNQKNNELIVIHCAGIVSIASKYDQLVYDVNVHGTKNIVDLCVYNHVKKLIYVSSVHAIPEKPKGEVICEIKEFEPDKVIGLYAKTKSEATAYVLSAVKKGLNANIVHPSGILGPFDNSKGHLTTLVIDYCKGRLFLAMNGGYDFVDVRDVANGIVSCCEKGGQGQCYILSNKYFTVKELLYMLHEISGRKEIKHFLPLWFIKLAAPLAENYYKLLRQPPLLTKYSIYTLNSNAKFTYEKAARELDYTTRNMNETLMDTINWLKDNKRL